MDIDGPRGGSANPCQHSHAKPQFTLKSMWVKPPHHYVGKWFME
jgi:hypothetical protein